MTTRLDAGEHMRGVRIGRDSMEYRRNMVSAALKAIGRLLFVPIVEWLAKRIPS